MKKLLMAGAATAFLAGAVSAEEVKVGVIFGFTGPIESLTPDMALGAETAFNEVNASGALLGGSTISVSQGDSTCIDAAAASATAEGIIADGAVAIVGADCSGVTTAIANNVAVPKGIPMVSPSATSPALSDIDDNGLFFRTAPSDARQGQLLAEILQARGVSNIAVTYTNNDYGKGLADAFAASFEAAGGTIAISAPHEDDKGDYSAEVAALAAAGADMLAVFGYVDKGGLGIIQGSLDTGAFDTFVLGDGMYGTSLTDALGADLNGTFGTVPGGASAGADVLKGLLEGKANDPSGPYTGESYDAAALIALAMQAGGSSDSASIAANILNVANAPGEQIGVGELAKGLEILAGGGEVDYVGATGVELIGPGEASGTYREFEVVNGQFETVKIH